MNKNNTISRKKIINISIYIHSRHRFDYNYNTVEHEKLRKVSKVVLKVFRIVKKSECNTL